MEKIKYPPVMAGRDKNSLTTHESLLVFRCDSQQGGKLDPKLHASHEEAHASEIAELADACFQH